MTKNFKLVMALILAAMMIASMIPAMAAGAGSITINNAVKDHKYTAYQIFSGSYANGKLGDIEWADGITAAGKTALYDKYGLTGANQTAAKVAEAIYGSTTNTAATADDSKAIEFANTVGTNVQNGHDNGILGADGSYVISNLETGYYMIVDTWEGAATATNGRDYSIARYMVQLVDTATVNNKADRPTVQKKIDGANDTDTDTTGDCDYNTANIGDAVPYKVTSKVPDYSGYKEYYMNFTDTLSKGLTVTDDYEAGNAAKKGAFTVKVGGTELTRGTEYTVTVGEYSATEGTSIAINFKDLVSRSAKFPVGAAIEITYSATVNDNAVVGKKGNDNTIQLTYSNNPLNSGDGSPDEGDKGQVNGQTPEDKVTTFLTELELTKVDGSNNTTPLEGAVFHVKGTRINKVLLTGDHFVADAAGTYYKLTGDKGYTTQAPTEFTKDQYADLTWDDGAKTGTAAYMYKKEAYAATSTQETASVDFEAVSNSQGKIILKGVATGTYTFTEIQAPAGYNLLDKPITVTVDNNIEDLTAEYNGTQTITWSATAKEGETDLDADYVTVSEDGKISFKIANNGGTTLPETGGIGTTIFYVAGSLMVLAAAILLITKRRMGAND